MNFKQIVLAIAVSVTACATQKAEEKPTPPPAAPAAEKKVEAAPAPDPMDAELSKRPAALDRIPKFDAPVPVERTLKNGMKLYVVENHALPLVSIRLAIGAGVDVEPAKEAGIAPFVAQMLTEGTQKRTAQQIAADVEDLAAELDASAGPESITVSLDALSETLPKALDVMADVVEHPAFRKADVERVRGLVLTELAQKKASPQALAADEMHKLLYGPNHPWGRPAMGTPETIAKITPAELAKFHKEWFAPAGSYAVLAGDVTPDEAVKLFEARFGTWKAKAAKKPALPAFPKIDARTVSLIDKPGASQSQVWVAGRLPLAAASPEVEALQTANYSLGGLFSSRLNMNLREEHGFSYGVFSMVRVERDHSTFAAGGGIIAKHTAEAVTEYEKELARFAGGDLTADELARAKEAFIRSLPSKLETNAAVASFFEQNIRLGRPLDYFAKLPDRVRSLTLAEVQKVAKEYTKPAAWPVVIVGPMQDNAAKVKALNLGALVN